MNQKYQGHILYMPDGNRRFAKREGLSYEETYKIGAESLELFVNFFLLEKKCEQLTVHFMSKYTHNRTDGTLEPIYQALTNCFCNLYQKDKFAKNNLRFICIDHSGKLPCDLSDIVKKLESCQSGGQQIVRVLLGYDLETDERLAYEKSIDYNDYKTNLLIPKIDLVIRTTEMRPSGGPVYAMSQAQMISSQKLNPEIDRNELIEIWNNYNDLLDYRKTTNQFRT